MDVSSNYMRKIKRNSEEEWPIQKEQKIIIGLI